MTYEEIHQKFPGDFAARDTNKFQYRYPRGNQLLLPMIQRVKLE